jgi:hypothetical protein
MTEPLDSDVYLDSRAVRSATAVEAIWLCGAGCETRISGFPNQSTFRNIDIGDSVIC